MNKNILHLKNEYGALSERPFLCCSHCHINWCPLTMGIVISRCPLSQDVERMIYYLRSLGSECLNAANVILPQWNMFTMNLWTSKSTQPCYNKWHIFIPPTTKLGGGYWIHPVCPSVLSICPLTFRVRPVASTVQDGFFPYLVQMINSMRVCVVCDDPWPWPISSRSFSLDLENRVRSVASTVLDGFFLYMAQLITIIRGCVACFVFIKNLEILIFEIFRPWPWKKNLQFSMDSFHI